MTQQDHQTTTRLACMELRGGNVAVEERFAMPGLDAWVYSQPFEQQEAGGDVHYVSTCATGRIARVLVADVSGHGSDVVETAAVLRDLMARYVNFVDGRKFFAALNRRFERLAQGGRFATAVVATYFAPTFTLSVSNAGHPPPLLWCSATRTWSFLEQSGGGETRGRNLPLGVIDAARYDRFDVTLEPGDLVVCYTDFLNEARDPAGELISMDGLLTLAGKIDGDEAGSVLPDLLSALGAMDAENLRRDDLTLLAFRPNGKYARVPLRDRLLAPGRVLKGVLSSLRRGGRAAPVPELSVSNLGGAMFDGLSKFGRGR